LAVLNLRGFGGNENRNILNVPSLWERRARNKRSMILKGNKPRVSRQTMIRENKANKDSKHTAGKGCLESKYLAARSATS
jgi:hypothetical protein